MNPGRLALVVRQGETFRRRFIWKAPLTAGATPTPKDLTGWSARSQVRVDGVVQLTFDSAGGVDGTITLGADGTIELLASESTVNTKRAGSGAWSLKLTPPVGDSIVLIEGAATIREEITQ